MKLPAPSVATSSASETSPDVGPAATRLAAYRTYRHRMLAEVVGSAGSIVMAILLVIGLLVGLIYIAREG
jgi:hypothetical protein